MKKLIWTTVTAALAVTIAAAVAVAGAAPIAFTAKYTGTAVTKQTDNTVAITANGTGSALKIGSGKITGVGSGDTSQRPCVPFTGTGSMTGSGGTISFKVNPGASSCGDDAGQIFSFTGKAAVLKATGKLAKAKGILKMTGTYDRSSGAFSVKFSGKLAK